MKSLRLLLKSSSMALLCLLTFSCVDTAYDISKVKDATILKNGVDVPLGYLELSMDSILKDVDPTLLKIKDGVYTFSKGSTIDLSSVNNALSGFTPSAIPSPAPTFVNMLDGTNLPTVPSNVPMGTTSYAGSTSVTLPSFNTTLMNPVDSILLNNTTFTMRASTNNLGGAGLNNAITITCTVPAGSPAEYYDVTTNAKITTWTMQANTNKQIGIRKIKPANGSILQIDCGASLNVTSNGSVTITAKAMTSISVSVAFSAVDFQTVYGKVNYSKLNNSTSIDFGGFGDIVGSNSVISFYDPTIKMYSNSNLGVPIKLNVKMSSENTLTHATATMTTANLTMLPAANPTSTKANVLTIDQPNNGLANLFKINPDVINMSYDVLTDANTSNHFVNKNTLLTLSDTVEVPLRFASDMELSSNSDLENPFLDIVKDLPVQDSMKMGFLLEVTNRIPLAMKIRLTAVNATGTTLFSVETGNIKAAKGIGSNGFATDTTMTSTELLFTTEQINMLKNVPNFKVDFLVSATQTTGFVALRPSDYIKIKVAARIKDGVKLDFDDETTN